MTAAVSTCNPWGPVALDKCQWRDEAHRQASLALAQDFLWAWSGRVFGTCTVMLRPCRDDCGRPSTWQGGSGGAWRPVLIDGVWKNIACGQSSCADACSCDGTRSLRLPGPVDSINEILIDGKVVPTGTYRVDNHALLVDLTGAGWPSCQALSRPPDEEGTWMVTYQLGTAVPAAGLAALGVLACEMGKSLVADPSCQLPRRLQQISRQGVSMTMLDDMEDLSRTGLWLVDSWLASLRAPRPGRVYSPDIPRPRVVTWP